MVNDIRRTEEFSRILPKPQYSGVDFGKYSNDDDIPIAPSLCSLSSKMDNFVPAVR